MIPHLNRVLSAANRMYRLRIKTANDIDTDIHTTNVRHWEATFRKKHEKESILVSLIEALIVNKVIVASVGVIKWMNARRFSFLYLNKIPNFDICIFFGEIRKNIENWIGERIN